MSMTADLRDCFEAAGVAGGRVYRDLRIQGSPTPAVTLQLITEARDALMKGEQTLISSRVQVDCWADARGLADALAEQVLAARPARQAHGTTDFRRVYVDSIDTDFEDEAAKQTSGTTYRTRIDLIVWWRPKP